LLTFLILIFVRPFVSSLAFPYLNLIYSELLFIFLGAYFINKKPLFLKPKALINPVILFFLALSISLIFSQNKVNSLSEFYKYISGLLLFLIAANLSEKEELLVKQTIIVTGLAISLLAIYQYFFGFKNLLDYILSNNIHSFFISDYLANKRVFVPFVTPGILGGYLAMVIPLFFIKKNRRWFILLIFFALFLTKSLGAFLSLFFGLIIYFYLRERLKKSIIFYLLGSFIFMAVVFVLRFEAGREHTQPFFSMVMRLSYWKDAFGIIKTHPLVGIGLGNFDLNVSRYAHNSYLQIWVETGILGLLSFIWIIYSVLKTSFKDLTQSLDRNQSLCLLVAGIVFLIHNFLDFTFFLPEVVYIWWVILGLISAQCRKQA